MTNKPNVAQPGNWSSASSDETLRELPLKELLSHITDGVKVLASKEAELAKAELQSNLRAGLATARNFGAAAVCGLLGLNMLLVAAVLGLASFVEPWMSALILGAALLATGAVMGAIAWSHRLKNPLESTRASVKEDVQWLNNRLA